ncbi:epimerase/ hydratase [Corynascus novoguineensis]|uniref:Epimerase/ hydratase n=1 Tax=Corynascus novoguineensis TaxID=1126955 RepID=A0AAN7CMT0_9PEZI|nr:epimerase/ hydratase [Corynascus novoguineensis]
MAAVEPKVVFILGGGPRIGHAVARKFSTQGYKVAIGRRNTDKSELDGVLPVFVDLIKPETIEEAFREVESKLGVPNVVVYNAAALTFPPENDPFGVEPAAFTRDLAVNVDGAYAALHHATRLARRHSVSPLVFIATGNVTPFQPHPLAVTLGSGKSALAHLISLGTAAYDAKEFRFHFASQVTDNGGPVPYPDVSGELHGEVYWKLANEERFGWDVRFAVGPDGSPNFTS